MDFNKKIAIILIYFAKDHVFDLIKYNIKRL
jgi:hypothetical protein